MQPAQSLYVRPKWGIDWAGPVGAADEANALLAQLAPRSDSQHWLHCYYEPGERWQPVERLVIAEMIPRSILAGEDAFYRQMGEENPESLFVELEGPNPRHSGHYDWVKGQFLYDGLPPNITQRQWMLWRSHRAYARAFWIVQGSYGGHKKSFSQLEKKILKLNSRNPNPPYAGQLPFARFDRRILDQLNAMDKLQKWMETRQADFKERTAEDRAQAREAAMAEVDDKIYDWLGTQLADLAA